MINEGPANYFCAVIPKKLDVYMLKRFLPLLVGAFVVALFVFIMQFLWRYVDELIGKGLSLDVLGKFFWYATLTLVSQALPLAVLLGSLIVFGNMGEELELTAFKSAGIPLRRITQPVFIFIVVLSVVSFVFQNNVSPNSQKQLMRLIASLKQTSPVLEIPEGVFYGGIPNINMFVERKDAETGMLYGVMIYKFDRGWDNQQIVVADSASLRATADKHYLELRVYSGEQFENLQDAGERMADGVQVPYDRESFGEKTLLITFDTGFDLMDESIFGEQSKVKSLTELRRGYDSLMIVYDSVGSSFARGIEERFLGIRPAAASAAAALNNKEAVTLSIDSLLDALHDDTRLSMLRSANNATKGVLNDLEWEKNITTDGYKNARRHLIQWHKKFALSLACIIFFLIGSSLGAIIRKGGMGVPTVISVVIFIIYYVVDTGSMKTAREGDIPVWLGMWFSTICLAPVSLWLSWKANNDSMFLNPASVPILLRSFFGLPEKRNVALKEVVIEEPNYLKEREVCRTLQASINSPDFQPEELECFVERLGNSRDARLLSMLGQLPVLSTHGLGRLKLRTDKVKAAKQLHKIEGYLNNLTINNG